MKLKIFSLLALLTFVLAEKKSKDGDEGKDGDGKGSKGKDGKDSGSKSSKPLKTNISDKVLSVDLPDKTDVSDLTVSLVELDGDDGKGEGKTSKVGPDGYELVDKKVENGKIYASAVDIKLGDLDENPDSSYKYKLKAGDFEGESQSFTYDSNDKKFAVGGKKKSSRYWSKPIFWIIVVIVALLVIGVLVKICM
jgi:hypothetical protein